MVRGPVRAAVMSSGARAEIDAQEFALLASCRSWGAPLTGDGMVREATAARVLGVAAKTLRNDRSGARRWPFVKRGGAVFYRVRDLAVWLLENNDGS